MHFGKYLLYHGLGELPGVMIKEETKLPAPALVPIVRNSATHPAYMSCPLAFCVMFELSSCLNRTKTCCMNLS